MGVDVEYTPAAQRRISDLHNDICLVLDRWDWAILEPDIELAVEDHSFHCIFRHLDAPSLGRSYNLICLN